MKSNRRWLWWGWLRSLVVCAAIGAWGCNQDQEPSPGTPDANVVVFSDAAASSDAGAHSSDAAAPDAMVNDAMTDDAMVNDAMTDDAMVNDAMTDDAMVNDAMPPDGMGMN